MRTISRVVLLTGELRLRLKASLVWPNRSVLQWTRLTTAMSLLATGWVW